MDHTERRKDFTLAESIKRFVGEAFEGYAKDDESDVAVFSAGARVGCQRRGEGGVQQVIAILRFQKQLLVSGKAGGMREQHSQGYIFSTKVGHGVSEKFRNDRRDRSVEIEQPALIEQHCRGRSSHDFGEGCEIEECRRLNFRRRLVREISQSCENGKFSPVSNGDRSSGEGTISYRCSQNRERIGELLVLMFERVDEPRTRSLSRRIQDRHILRAIGNV